jgi:hypothetical protein
MSQIGADRQGTGDSLLPGKGCSVGWREVSALGDDPAIGELVGAAEGGGPWPEPFRSVHEPPASIVAKIAITAARVAGPPRKRARGASVARPSCVLLMVEGYGPK